MSNISCPCECHTAVISGGRYHCLSGKCCDRSGESKLCPMLPDENGKPTPPIPWALAVEIYKLYHEVCSNDQTLEQIASRGGFGWPEIQSIVKRWHKKKTEETKKASA
jgi:hypothetical protein